MTWAEVQQRLISAQREHLMCISNKNLTELDIYHRILRHKNYMVAMVNKDILPVKLNLPFMGEKLFFSRGLNYNLELLFFRMYFSPFSKYHLKDEFKKPRGGAADGFRDKIALAALVNLLLMPVVFLWQLLYSFYNYAELLKRNPSTFGMRKWSLYGRLYLRHFNELDHELKGRLTRAYKPANKYLELFVSPLSVVLARSVRFIAGSVLAVIIVLAAWDEDVMAVEHMITLFTGLFGVIYACSVFIPDENMVHCPERLLSAVVAHTHYFPGEWRGRAHTTKVRTQDSFCYFRVTHGLCLISSSMITR